MYKDKIGYSIKTSSASRQSIFGNNVSNNMFTMSDLVGGNIDQSGLYGIGMWSYAAFNTVFLESFLVTIPILETVPEITVTAFPFQMSMISVTNSSNLIKFTVEFYDINDNLIITYNQNVDSDMWDQSAGYQTGELAVFSLPELSPVFDIGTYGHVIKFRLQAFTLEAASNYSEFFELMLTDLIPHAPELYEGAFEDHNQVFRWISASDLPLLAHELNYNLEIYSSTSSLSSLYAFSLISALNSVSYCSTLSGLQQSGLLNILLSQSGIAGQISYTYWGLLSQLSAGSYFARVGVLDSGLSMVWSLFSPFSIGLAATSKDLILRPGFNLYSIPLNDMDANTARRLVEEKVGYKVVQENLVPYLSEIIKWKEEGEANNKWESVVASEGAYTLTNDFDIQNCEGYFINLNNDESIVVRFSGTSF